MVTSASSYQDDGSSEVDEGEWAVPYEFDFDPADDRPRVVIIGAGFGGMKAARELRHGFRVTVIDCKNYFQYGPGVLRSFVQPEHFDNICFPLRPVLEGDMSCKFVWGELQTIDRDTRCAHVTRLQEYCGDDERRWRKDNVTAWPARKCSAPSVVEFDYCIIAAGCSYNKMKLTRGASLWFPTVLSSHLESSAWNHHDERTIEGRRLHITEEFQKLQKMNSDKDTALVVGGGFIGVEWACEVKAVFQDINVVIVSRPQQILCRWPRRAVEYAQAHLDRTEGLRCIFGTVYDPSDPDMFEKIGLHSAPSAVYACTGVQASVKFVPQECLTQPRELGEDEREVGLLGAGEEMPYRSRHGKGWVRVNKKLQVVTRTRDGGLHPWCADDQGRARVFSIGDCTSVAGLPPLPKQCYPAEEQAFIVSRIIQMTEAEVQGAPERGMLGCGPPRPLPDSHWPWGAGMVVLSLGFHDACFVFANTHEDGSGIVGLVGTLAVLQKDVIELSKTNEEKNRIVGKMIWHYVHNTPFHLWGEGPLCGY
jgi:NADH dehydrogenase FAD-containing subunit